MLFRSFTPAGKANNEPGFWAKQKTNIAPRLSVVYAPDSKTSIRAGGGMYYDHFGEALTSRFSRLGSFGLSSQFESPASFANYHTAPRFTGPHDLPNLPVPAKPPTQTYPYAVPDGTFGINWGIDNHVKTPYVEAFNFSIQAFCEAAWVSACVFNFRVSSSRLANSAATNFFAW